MENGTSSQNGFKETNGELLQAPPETSAQTQDSPSPPWRIYLYGAGMISHHHATAALLLPNVQIFAADPSAIALTTFSTQFPHAQAFSSATTMLSSSPAQDRDIVIIAVPLFLHLPATLAAFASGRHVLCEKPVARNLTDLNRMLAAAHNAGRMFTDCSIRYLGNGALDRARELISSNGIGTPYHARLINRAPRSRPGIEYQPSSKWFLNKEKAGGGTVFDFGVYDIAMLCDVFRPVEVVVTHAWVATPKTGVDPKDVEISVETHAGASMTMLLPGGETVNLDYERASGFHGKAEPSLNVDGTAGGLSWEWIPTFDADLSEEGASDSFRLTHYLDVRGQVEKREERFKAFGWNEANMRPLMAFVQMIEGREGVALGVERLRFGFEIVEAVYRVADGRVPVVVRLGA